MKFVLFVKEFRVLSSSVGVRNFFKEVQVDVGLISVEITRQHPNGWYHKEINPYSNGVLKDYHLKLQPNVLRRCTEKSTGALYVHNDSCIKNSCFDLSHLEKLGRIILLWKASVCLSLNKICEETNETLTRRSVSEQTRLPNLNKKPKLEWNPICSLNFYWRKTTKSE